MNELLLSAGDRLQVRFSRRGDRWDHAVEMRIDGEPAWQLNSVEGAADDDWPPSPPFQSLELHTEPDGRKFVLLVGMAGKSHWSASVEADPAAERVVFDIACRIKAEPKWLGSSYAARLGCGERIERISRDDAEVNAAAVAALVRLESLTYGFPSPEPRAPNHVAALVRLESLTYGVARLALSGDRIQVGAGDSAGSLPRTVRWKYAIPANEPA